VKMRFRQGAMAAAHTTAHAQGHLNRQPID